jgi:hypothetical protein
MEDSNRVRRRVSATSVVVGATAFFVTFLVGLSLSNFESDASDMSCDGVIDAQDVPLIALGVAAFCALWTAWIVWERLTRDRKR